jgi:tRNA(fMet)-specific endonuclease VapC
LNYLVDSDWIIDALAGVRSAVVALRQHTASGLAVSIISLGEVFEGAYHFPDPSRHLAGFRRFLLGFTVLGLSDPVMELFAQTRHAMRSQGNLIPDLDLLIGVTAVHHNLTLMTRNCRHFSRVPGLQLYTG